MACAILSALLMLPANVCTASHELYENVLPANTSDCLDKVTSLPLVMYEFKYDSVKGRRQLGSIGPGLERVIPESVEMHARSMYPSPQKGEPPITLENTAVVDKTVIFMHNVGATQELAKRNDKLLEQLDELMENDVRVDTVVAEIESRMLEEADAQLLERKRIVEAEAEEARLAVELERVKAAEYRKTMEIEAEQQRQALEHQTLVAKQKLKAEADAERAKQAELLRMQDESAQRREALRLETEVELRNQRMELEREMDAAKLQMDVDRVKAEVQAKVDAEKENEDVELRKIRAQGEEDRKRMQETINMVIVHTASVVAGLIADPRRAFVVTAWILGLATGYLVLRETTLITRQILESYLGKPRLVRETTRINAQGAALQSLRSFMLSLLDSRRWLGGRGTRKLLGREEIVTSAREIAVLAFHDVVLAPDLKDQVLSLSVATRNARNNGAPYRHLLLYGPPGTGKTMVAKRLAACSGMECAIMSGGDVGPLGTDAVTALHGLFRWAAKSPRGLLLFIDEAEAFLGKRSGIGMSEDTRNALNALLYNTGSASYRLMMVLATNRAEDLDEAVLDRMDDSLLFPLPDKNACSRLLVQYFNKYCGSGSSNGSGSAPRRKWAKMFLGAFNSSLSSWRGAYGAGVQVEAGVDDRLVAGMADEVNGFSGREISKLMLAVQSCAFGSEDGVLTGDMLKRVVAQKVNEHRTKAGMRTGRDP